MGQAVDGLIAGTFGGGLSAQILGQVLEPDETRQAITFLIVCLIGIAIMLGVLTVWYWHYTSPKRRAEMLLADLGHFDAAGDPVLEPVDVPPTADRPVLVAVAADSFAAAGGAGKPGRGAAVGLDGDGMATITATVTGPTPIPDHIRLAGSPHPAAIAPDAPAPPTGPKASASAVPAAAPPDDQRAAP
ncbi:MAG: hypothetical protein AAGA65_28860, partial [Actinomycetota bacterium]